MTAKRPKTRDEISRDWMGKRGQPRPQFQNGEVTASDALVDIAALPQDWLNKCYVPLPREDLKGDEAA